MDPERLAGEIPRRATLHQPWVKSGRAKTLISAGAANDRVDIAPHPDGGVIVARTFGTFPTYKHTVRRFDKSLNAVGAPYSIASVGLDFAKVAVLSATKAVLVFKQNPGRSRLMAQILQPLGRAERPRISGGNLTAVPFGPNERHRDCGGNQLLIAAENSNTMSQ